MSQKEKISDIYLAPIIEPFGNLAEPEIRHEYSWIVYRQGRVELGGGRMITKKTPPAINPKEEA